MLAKLPRYVPLVAAMILPEPVAVPIANVSVVPLLKVVTG